MLYYRKKRKSISHVGLTGETEKEREAQPAMSLTVHTNKTKHHLSTTVAPRYPRFSRRYSTPRGNVSSLTKNRGHLSIHDMFLPTRHFPNLSYTTLHLIPSYLLFSYFLFTIKYTFHLSIGNYFSCIVQVNSSTNTCLINDLLHAPF